MPQGLLIASLLATGALLGLQARINGELGARLGSALDAAAVSFLGGTLLLVVLFAARAPQRAALSRLAASRTRWPWWLIGGAAGAAVVAATAEAVPQIGVALVTVCVVAGTAVGALVVDLVGLSPGGRFALSPLRVTGAVLAVTAVLLGAAGDRHAAVRPVLFAVVFATGVGSALQQAANGRLRLAARDALVAALVSFSVGTGILLVAVLATRPDAHRHWPAVWWLYTGGAMGVVFVALASAVVSRVGVLVVGLSTVAGQLVAAVVLDVAWPAPGRTLHASSVVSALLTLVAVALAAVGARRGARGYSPGR